MTDHVNKINRLKGNLYLKNKSKLKCFNFLIKACTNNTGWNTISEYGIIRTGSAFVTAYNWHLSHSSPSSSGQGANYRSNDFKVWSDYHKESNHLDELLAKVKINIKQIEYCIFF